ncbi:fumarate hydrolyase [Ornatilinea apprima]|uniref:Fumarate hydrolyase n=1 Tax=Ornatilinea apprima TaxID=1134406 RepID=A0A0P6XJK4_9CHLR|nr:FumA C-terminus/TtdB family hydratase beta subunit [Ornatilinea apprima]KPL71453.1 fumarate hydrolyase [Ornatilinea apprima]
MNDRLLPGEQGLRLPLSDEQVRVLRVGQAVRLSGRLVTARDAAHQWLVRTFIQPGAHPSADELAVLADLRRILAGGAIYHCGPVVAQQSDGSYRFLAAGPTTSAREEPYQADVMRFFNVKAVIGKGGMGARTLRACQQTPAVYLHAVGGAAALIAQTVRRVETVYQLEFGVPEALWVIEVEDFPAVVTMDALGASLHEEVRRASQAELDRLLGKTEERN